MKKHLTHEICRRKFGRVKEALSWASCSIIPGRYITTTSYVQIIMKFSNFWSEDALR